MLSAGSPWARIATKTQPPLVLWQNHRKNAQLPKAWPNRVWKRGVFFPFSSFRKDFGIYKVFDLIYKGLLSGIKCKNHGRLLSLR
jgi:hypothetical protein